MNTIIEYIFNWLDGNLPFIIMPLIAIMFFRIFYCIITH